MAVFTWDDKAEYLIRTRKVMFNDDYLAFLVSQVWKINQPVSIVDFGCGLGFVGMKLLPLLPQGSSYTGLDRSVPLLEQAKGFFVNSGYTASFIQANAAEVDVDEGAFDIAICQALLLHMSEPQQIVKKMIHSVKHNGLVACIEPHWNGAMASMYIKELDMLKCIDLGFLQRLYEYDRLHTGKDGNIGLKLPVILRELGLLDVQSRLSDAVAYLNPALEDDTKRAIVGVLEADGYTKPPKDLDGMVSRLMERGALEEEARAEFERERTMAESLRDHALEFNTVFAYHMVISFGWKP